MKRLDGKTALITGAARGIGRAFAAAYMGEGARVAIADIDGERARQTAAELGEAAIAVDMDVTDQASIDRAVAETVAALGGIDILINNAAIFTAAPIVEITRDDYARVFDINVAGTLFTLQAVARHMIGRGQGGKIINMASQAGRRGEALVAVYCATKAAVISLTQSAGLTSSGTASTSMPSPRASSMANIGTASMRSLPDTKARHPARKSARWARLCPMGGWAGPRI
jgi:NAD(P)-dependent dehydrogenase (short-subunit alcohol dehydrogenase family)